MKNVLEVKNLHVSVADQPVLNGVDLSISEGSVHAIMGPNGSGKSTLSLTLMGHPAYKITDGSVVFGGKDLVGVPTSQRANAGMFLAFQSPLEIEGVTLKELLYQASGGLPVHEFEEKLAANLRLLDIPPAFVERSLNVGFSGGEKKRVEILQLAMLKPKLVILDEIDSGLDIDALKVICEGINKLKQDNPAMALLVITHYPRILKYLIPDKVHVMQEGTIVKSGTIELAQELEREGYN